MGAMGKMKVRRRWMVAPLSGSWTTGSGSWLSPLETSEVFETLRMSSLSIGELLTMYTLGTGKLRESYERRTISGLGWSKWKVSSESGKTSFAGAGDSESGTAGTIDIFSEVCDMSTHL